MAYDDTLINETLEQKILICKRYLKTIDLVIIARLNKMAVREMYLENYFNTI